MPKLKKQSHDVKKAKDKQRKKILTGKKCIDKGLSNIIRTGALITDDTICRVLQLLRTSWPTVNIGFRLPSEVEVLRKTTTTPLTLLPINVHAINIHYIDLHWVTSWQDPCDLSIKIYDSLYNHNRLIRLLPVLRLFYHLEVYTPKYVRGISQQTESSCGAFASAFAVCCASHNSPERYRFTSDAEMRQHLMHCISNGAISMFPAVPCVPCVTIETCTFLKTLTEIETQKQLNRQKKMKSQEKSKITSIEFRDNAANYNTDNKHTKKARITKHKETQSKKRDQETNYQRAKRMKSDKERHSKQRHQETNIVKAKRQKDDKIRHTKQREQEKNIVKAKRQKDDKERHTKQRDRETNIVKAKRQKDDKERHTKQRGQETNIVKVKRQKDDKERHTKQRGQETNIAKAKRQKDDKERHTKQRGQETNIAKAKRQKNDKERHTKQRGQETNIVKAKRQKHDKERHTKQRGQETNVVKAKRQKDDKERHTNQRDQETNIVKAKRQKDDKERRTKLRDQETNVDRQMRLAVQKKRQSNCRQKENFIKKADRQKVDKERRTKRIHQETNLVKAKRQKLDKERHTKQRQQETKTEKAQRQNADRERHNKSRIPQSLETATKTFLNEIKNSPEYACTVCHRLMYKENSTVLKISNFKDIDLITTCRTKLYSVTDKEWICKTCVRHLKRSSIPPQAQVNKMSLSQEECVIDELTDFESRLLAKRIPFMKITALPRGKQKGIIGPVINVPSDVDETCEVLPRTPHSSGIIPVKLKRKQEYKNYVFYEHVRPNKVLEAFQWLKHNNIHYKEVIDGSQLWEKTFQEEDNQLYNHLTQPELPSTEDGNMSTPADETSNASDMNNVDTQTELPSTVDETMSTAADQTRKVSHFIENNAELHELNKQQPLDTCVQTSDLVLDVSKVLNFSPGEGKTPIGCMMDHGCEEMAFPVLFPTGKYGFDAERQIHLTPKKYFNARILNKSGKFARNTEYLFFAQFVTEYKQVMDNISIALRKTFSRTETGTVLNSSMVQNAEIMSSLITKDHAYQFLQTVRGSPPYWQKAMYKLLAAVKQFGIFTFFVTLSSADLKWHDTLQAISKQQGNPLTTDQIDNLSFEEKSSLLRSNPVTAARHFDHRLQSFFRLFLLSPAEPLGKIKHYSYRIEFQQRGSPHAHIVIWTENSPTPADDEEIICNFIDKYITCSIPSEDSDLYELVTSVQQHHHSHTCKKKGTFCRFNYPKLPSNNTVIATKVELDDPVEREKTVEKNTMILAKVKEVVQDKDSNFSSVEQMLQLLGISMEDYTNALKMSNRGSSVVLCRKPSEKYTNCYNREMLRAWGANIDVQYCLDPYACITYMVAYITKDEREISQILHTVSEECANMSWKQKMKNCAKAFLNAREISAQEAVYRLLSFPLFKCNFRTVFVPAALPQNRITFLKPLSVIQSMDSDDEDIFQKGVIDKYALRPRVLKDVCLAHFAVWYVPAYNVQGSRYFDSENDDSTETTSSNVIVLSDESTSLKKASKPAVLRYHRQSENKSPEEYYYSQLLLYLPWNNEEELLSLPSYQEHYLSNIDLIQQNRSHFEYHADIIETAIENFEINGPPTHAYDEICPALEQQQSEMLEEGVQLDPEATAIQPLPEHEDTNLNTMNHIPSHTMSYSIEMRPGVLPDDDYHLLVRSLNMKQKDVYQHVLKWCSSVSQNKTPTDQLCIFVSGGAGTGKSHLISALYQMAIRTLQTPGDNPDDIRVSLAAPTGTAAHNISGITLHSAFLLPLGQTKSYVRLSDEKRNALRAKAAKLDLLIIDEISMVSSDLLLQIHNRLCEIKATSTPFGGVSVIAFGDMFQLPPVLQPFVFKPVKDVLANLTGSLWRTFHFKELDEIMRQRQDLHFAELLNRVRTATHTEEDIQFLKSREITPSSENYPKDSLHVFATNKAVDAHNNTMLDSLETNKVTFVAVDKKPAALSSYDVNSDTRFTGGLPSVIHLAIGAKVMLIRNIDVTDGLVNGAQGTVVGFITADCNVSVVLIHFNQSSVGAKARANSRHVTASRKFPLATPIERTEISFTVNKKNKGLTITRFQFPLKLAWGCTIHKVQGLTVSKIVVSFKQRFNDGQAYVALSRVSSAHGLYLLDFDPEKIRANKTVREEMNFLSKERTISPHYRFFQDTSSHPETLSHIISLLNVRSLPCHILDVQGDYTFQMSNINVLTETWLSNNIDSHSLLPQHMYNVERLDRKLSSSEARKAGGVLVSMQKCFDCNVVETYVDSYCQILMLHIAGLLESGFYLLAIYNSPRTNNYTHLLLQKITSMLSKFSANYPCMIIGDFNENALSETIGPIRKTLESMQFRQQVKERTHVCGSCLDHVYTRNIKCMDVCINPTYYSDHFWISCKIA